MKEANQLRFASFFLYFIIGVCALFPTLTASAAILLQLSSGSRVPVFSDITQDYPLVVVGASAFFLVLILFFTQYRVFSRLLVAPIVGLEVTNSGVFLRDALGKSRAVLWSDPNLHLKLDAYSPSLITPTVEGYHWGRVLFVSGYRGGWCQIDDVVFNAIRASARSRGVSIVSTPRKTLEGPTERWLFQAPVNIR